MNPETVQARHRALLELENSVTQAIRQRNGARLRELLPGNFVFRGAGDVETDREAFIASVAAIPGDILELEMTSVRAHVFGDTGVLTGAQRARVRLPDGTEVTDRQTFTDVCQWRDGRWWMVLAHSLPSAPETAEGTTPGPASP
ncbi:nuclear transport factor 2 family protein [Myxococcus sp. RHSTA-1-4]|uniref:nuclear transport factor 2 family protein n=1 Tax=Myxococcus sp. RHSTA-1-4 TaxID=2874601 RepID=UPI001CBBE71D|nr:nuclear transport factor 2 family protein [Myxococcus sp. RHSTA-1-4]MBZ4420679.1 nuclear transport factor 2 family protein [Myxococcus sp. RHSTA-1-4]